MSVAEPGRPAVGSPDANRGRGAHAAVTAGADLDDPHRRPSPTHRLAGRGILILIVPRLLNNIVAVFLIVSGVIGLGLIR